MKGLPVSPTPERARRQPNASNSLPGTSNPLPEPGIGFRLVRPERPPELGPNGSVYTSLSEVSTICHQGHPPAPSPCHAHTPGSPWRLSWRHRRSSHSGAHREGSRGNLFEARRPSIRSVARPGGRAGGTVVGGDLVHRCRDY